MTHTKTIASLELAKKLYPTAQEIFEKEGYFKEEYDCFIIYRKCDWEIVFDLQNKEYDASEVTINLHKAITEQMKELGWIE